MVEAASTAKRPSVVRQVVLVILLLVLAGAAVYDFKVARPTAKKAYEKISEESEKDRAEPLTNKDISQLLGKTPAQTLAGENSYLEKYTWTSGLVFKKHYMWVVYSPNEPHLFQLHYLNQPVDEPMRHDYKSPAAKGGSLPAQPRTPSTEGSAAEAGGAATPNTETPGGPPSGVTPPSNQNGP